MDYCGAEFEIIERAKADLLRKTNIDTHKEEMEVLDDFLFRCWQMGWLDRYEKHGRWIDGENMNGEKFLADIKYCSVCHKEAYWDSERGQQLFPCCPNCGARME